MQVNGKRFLRGQSGDGKMGLVFALLLVAGLVYFLKLAIPPRIQAAEYREQVERTARAFVVQQVTYDQMILTLLDEAKKAGIPIAEEDIKYSDSEARVSVRIQYDIEQSVVGGKTWVRHYDIDVSVPKI